MRYFPIIMVFLFFGCNSEQQDQPPISVTTILETTTSWDGEPLVYPEGEAKVTGMIIEIAPGQETGWHKHPVPNFGMLLEGKLEVSLEDGRSKRIEAGEALAEVVNVMHNGKNIGDVPVKILVFYAGVVGKELTIQ